LFGDRRRPDGRRDRGAPVDEPLVGPAPEPVAEPAAEPFAPRSSFAVEPAGPDGRVPVGRAPGRRPSARPAARARSGSARHGSEDSFEAEPEPGGRAPGRRLALGRMSISYAAWIARKRGTAASPAASGWFAFASRR
jgi:hypothetical protein